MYENWNSESVKFSVNLWNFQWMYKMKHWYEILDSKQKTYILNEVKFQWMCTQNSVKV